MPRNLLEALSVLAGDWAVATFFFAACDLRSSVG